MCQCSNRTTHRNANYSSQPSGKTYFSLFSQKDLLNFSKFKLIPELFAWKKLNTWTVNCIGPSKYAGKVYLRHFCKINKCILRLICPQNNLTQNVSIASVWAQLISSGKGDGYLMLCIFLMYLHIYLFYILEALRHKINWLLNFLKTCEIEKICEMLHLFICKI